MELSTECTVERFYWGSVVSVCILFKDFLNILSFHSHVNTWVATENNNLDNSHMVQLAAI